MLKSKHVPGLFLLLVCFACARQEPEVVSLPYYNDAALTPYWPESTDQHADSLHAVLPFALTNQFGDQVSRATVEGKIYVADFFFTSCPGICAKMAQNMGKIQQAFTEDDDVLLLSHSVTPEIDSVQVLYRYAEAHGVEPQKWHLLTGQRRQIYQLARDGYFADEDIDLDKDENQFLHTENFYLIDRKGHIRGIYKGTYPLDVEQLIADIAMLKSEGS